MSWNIFDIIGVVLDALDLLGSSSAPSWETKKTAKRKKSKYFVEWFSTFFTVTSLVLLFIVFKDPLLVQSPFQTICIAILIGIVFTFSCCFALYLLESFYFKSFLSMMFFCTSLILLSTASVLYLYIRSGLF
ncbi:branched-chain amino acid ABC transporter substrate-binding protein [Chryseobacterium sp. G0201]|uniref:branched-chain amino acid ABC transporter substrate-binding protein n=1 Tax=Chryseobacterium sp. G0201 TaxID=2487065 RepID=UPI000F50BA74|nr:branched-chain amino acid ABC transporter substrate-binding protein [Chryseobacterium sp. G0201]AZA54152.1 branched-chain amino acid ABC transporter substrate-binding protein [Chryseobacterium sp. G0201]